MNPPPKILDTESVPSQLRLELNSGIIVLMPLEHVPTLLMATEKERQNMEIFDYSLHWESLDCDLSVEGLLADTKENAKSRTQGHREILCSSVWQIIA